MLILDITEWGGSSITAAHDGSCYVFTYDNTLAHYPGRAVEIIVDGHRVTVFLTFGDTPDMFVVEAPRGFQVSEPIDVQEGASGTILSCPLLLG